jgi:hypothetical protein
MDSGFNNTVSTAPLVQHKITWEGNNFSEFGTIGDGEMMSCLFFGNHQKAEEAINLKKDRVLAETEQGTSRRITRCIYLLCQKEQNCMKSNRVALQALMCLLGP